MEEPGQGGDPGPCVHGRPDGRRTTTILTSTRAYRAHHAYLAAALLKQKDKFARAFSVKLLTYALGRPVGYTDRDAVDKLVAALKKDDYRIQSLVQAIVASEPFGMK